MRKNNHPSAGNARPWRQRILAWSIRGLLLGAAVAAALPATSAYAQEAASRQYAIPAGSLTEVLKRFGIESGLLLSFSTDLTTGRQSPGLNGNYTTAAALRELLRQSGLEAVPQGGGYLLRKAPAAVGGEAQLASVTVTAGTERNGTTEGSGSYKARYTNTATKLNLSPRETPQTVTVVTSQQMQDFGMTSVDDALKAVSGVFVADRGTAGAHYFSRGFDMQSQYDGIPNPVGISENTLNPQIDDAFLDRVEVLQGAAGLLTGAGQPGGTINLVRKRPTDTFQAQAEVQLASWDGRRIMGDISGPLTESGRIRGRVVALADDSKSFVDYVYRDRRAVYAVLEADLTPTTMLNASVQYQQDTGRNHWGAPFAGDGSALDISRSKFFGDAGHRIVKDYTLTTLGLTQRLGSNWQAKATFTHGKTNVDILRSSYVFGQLDAATGDGLELERTGRTVADLPFNALDMHVSGPLHLLGRQHEAAFGLNGSSMRRFERNAGFAIAPLNIHTYDPESLGDIPDSPPSFRSTKTTQFGAYGVVRFSVTDALKLITGVRISNYKDENLITGRTNKKESGVISPYAGLVYDLTPQASAYVSYSDIFNPQTQKSADGSTIKPIVGSNYEAGIKSELLDKRLNVSAAIFRLEQSNLARRDDSIVPNPANACGGTCYIAADKVVSQGIDLGASGELSPGWNVAAGYTFTDSKYASGATDGERFSPYRLATACACPPPTSYPAQAGRWAATYLHAARSTTMPRVGKRGSPTPSATAAWCWWG